MMSSEESIKEELEKVKRKLEILNEISKIINLTHTNDIEQILKEILNRSLQITETDKGFIALIEYSGDLIIKAMEGKGTRIRKLKISEGITGQVITTGKPYLCNDVTKDTNYKKCWKEVKTELAVPLIIEEEDEIYKGLELFDNLKEKVIKEKVIGVLNVEGIHPFTEDDKEILSSIARYTAVAVENTRLYRDRITLSAIGKTLSESEELYELLNNAVRGIPEQLHAKACSIFLLDEEKNKLVLGATTGLELKDYKAYKEIKYDIGEGLTGWIAKHEGPLRIKDITDKNELKRIASDLHWKNKFPENLDYQEKPKQFLGVPIKHKDKVIGVIRVSRKTHEEQEFTYRDESSLMNIASYIAIAIMNARLSGEKFKKLVKISDEFMKNLDSKELLNKAIVEETRKILTTDICALFLFSEEGRLELKEYISLDETGLERYILENAANSTAKNAKLSQSSTTISSEIINSTSKREKQSCDLEWSFLGVPVMNKEGKVIGVLEVGDKIERDKEIDDFLTEDMAILENLGTKAGMVIEFAKLLKKSEILQAVSHTLQTPLAGAEMCLQRVLDGRVNPDKLPTYLDEIYQNLQRFKRTTEHLVDYAKMELGKIEIKKEEQVDIKKIVEEGERIFYQRINEKKIRIEKNISEGISKVYADRIGIERIIDNLLDNAIKFSDEGNKVEINLYDQDKEIMVEIVNYNEPMPEAEVKKVFDKFYRGHTEKGRTIEGSGLGLYITKNWVEAHNGRIWVESSKYKGTRFKVTLPKGGA